MDDTERRRRGAAQRRAVLGDAYVERATAAATPFTADFQDLVTRVAWGEIWTRPGLDARTRRVLVIGTTIALGRWEELRLHVRAALDAGVLDVAELQEILLQQTVYCGVPAGNHAFAEVAALLAERGQAG